MENSSVGYYYQSVSRRTYPFLRRRLSLIYLLQQTRQSITFQQKNNGPKKKKGGQKDRKLGIY